MNSPTTTPMRAKEMDGVSDAKVQASVEGTMTVRRIWPSLAPRNRALEMRSASTLRAPWKVLKKTMKNTMLHASTILARSPKPNTMVMRGTSAMRGNELKATMNGSKTRAARSLRPRRSPATKPVLMPTRKPHSVDCTVESAIFHSGRRTLSDIRKTTCACRCGRWQAHVVRHQEDEPPGDGRGPADEERIDPVESRRARDGLDASEILPGHEDRHEDGDAPRPDARAAPSFHEAARSWSSSPRACQISPYSLRYSALSRRPMTSRGRGSFTS